jgi:hypothetical protein
MSCDASGRKAGKAAEKAGASSLASKFSHAAGVVADRALLAGYRAAARAAVVSDAVLNTVDRRGLAARLSRSHAVRGILAGAALEALGRRQAARQGVDGETLEQASTGAFAAIGASQALPAAALVTAVQQTSTHLATLASRATRTEEAGAVTQRRRVTLLGVPLGEAPERVTFWKSSLTKTLNALDAPIPGQSRGVRRSDGVLFQTGGATWHWGTLLVDTPRGERMLTHLQSLNLPAQHYYFDCALSDEQAVGIAAGRMRADQLPGYVGGVSALESLTLAWGAAKHAMIKNVIYCRRADREEP